MKQSYRSEMSTVSTWLSWHLYDVYHTGQWATLTFDLAFPWAFRWAKVRSKSRLK